MAQAVIFQHEPTLSISGKKTAATKDSGDVEAFSVQLDKQVKQNEPASKPTQTDSVTAANSAEADKDIAADGNNLPAETTAETKGAETAAADADSDTPEDTMGEATDTAATEQPEAVDDLAPAVETTDDATVTSAPSSALESTPAPATTDKPIRAQVTVSQQAVDHAKAAPVEMTAKAHPQQGVENNVQPETTAKVTTGDEKATVVAIKTENAQSALSQKAAVEANTTDKPTSPNLAAVLKQESEEGSKAPKIRADILEALQRQQSKQDPVVNLRNQIAGQLGAKADMPAVTLPSGAALADSNVSPLTTLVSAGVLTASGQSAAQGNALSPAVLSLPVQPGMQNPAWTQVMSSRVVWMAKEGVQQAQLRMNPANLGPVEVKLHIQNDQASVTFLAQHSATRDALEQALPRLRESFAENGMELTNAQVGEQQQQHREQSEQTSESHFFTQAASQEDDIENETVETVSSEQTSGLSLYA